MFDSISTGKWWDIGLNLVEGCTKVSPGCDNCWSLTAANMRRFNPNLKVAGRYEDTVTQWTHRKEGESPNWTGHVNPQWQDLDKIGRARSPKVYTFWNDLFHPGVPYSFVDEVLERIENRPAHFYIVCTKRPDRALEYFACQQQIEEKPINRLLLMTTAENQEWADRRIPILLQIPGVLYGVSYEPALGPVDLRPWMARSNLPLSQKKAWWQCACGTKAMPVTDETECKCQDYYDKEWSLHSLDWVICGGESGPHARPTHPDWVRSLRDQCVAAGTPFFFKSWGEFVPVFNPPQGVLFSKVGKKAAGRLLDGRTWNEVPQTGVL